MHSTSSIMRLPDDVLTCLSRSQKSLWIGTVSFEDRCRGSLAQLANANARVHRAIGLEYATVAHPVDEDRLRRHLNRETMRSLALQVTGTELHVEHVNAYALQDLYNVIRKVLDDAELDVVVLDISCLTKIHAIAFAASFAQADRTNLTTIVAYTSPDNYGDLNETSKRVGWRDVIIAPISDTAELLYESHSRGLVIAGHEADRLWVALNEIEPSGGLVLLGETPLRPDITRLCERLNKKLMRQLFSSKTQLWEREVVSVGAMEQVRTLVAREIAKAKDFNAPVILFPFGPKSLIYECARQLAIDYPQASWFVYPVPSGYDVDYSEGIGGSIWSIDQEK